MNIQKRKEMLKRFDEHFVNKLQTVNVSVDVWKSKGVVGEYISPDDIRAFLLSEIDTAVREREEELVVEIRHPARHFTLDSEDFKKGYVQASQDIINLIQSKKV